MFAVKLANFIMFAVSEESTFKCLEGSSHIFGNGRASSLIFENFRQSSGIFDTPRKSERNCRKMAENSFIFETK